MLYHLKLLILSMIFNWRKLYIMNYRYTAIFPFSDISDINVFINHESQTNKCESGRCADNQKII